MRGRKGCRGGAPAARREISPQCGRLARRPYSGVQKAAYWGILSALALALSWAESFVAPMLSLPMGVKPGLSNIAVMMACATLGLPAGLAVAAAKAVFAGVTRGLTAMLLSGAGGFVSALLMGALMNTPRLLRRHPPLKKGARLSDSGIGMLGGTAHNLTQLALAALMMKAPGVLWAAPWLILCGALAGAVTGTAVKFLRKATFFRV